ncbi:CsbD family protein [Pseudobdellovibrio exovorus]|uniref:CsbD-like domain-containing protein n=1 Tax=Pseudobdellovibrio exovorus JSS TaxID=1184267 RepID=M4V822_9BACT|nr:CsbD family protein [Pseudobdellovibrio exovorus]AGH94590.1 hypothetical protein A11Q_370 [Pseudobdellovibrio exovorus JSS]
MMNTQIAKGKWTQIKGEIMKAWGKLTDDELEQTKGDMVKVAGLVQQKYGETQESVRDRINDFLKSVKTDTDSKNEQPRNRM